MDVEYCVPGDLAELIRPGLGRLKPGLTPENTPPDKTDLTQATATTAAAGHHCSYPLKREELLPAETVQPAQKELN
jgi:hypothetical protein